MDIVGTTVDWPFFMRRLFWTRNHSLSKLNILSMFCYVNDLDIDTIREWSRRQHWFINSHHRNFFWKVFIDCMLQTMNKYSYCVKQRRYVSL